MVRATRDDIPDILQYIRPGIQYCFYMYIDIAKYGVDTPFMKVWIDRDGDGIALVVMQYHTGMTIYSDRSEWDIAGVAALVRENNIQSVIGRKDMVMPLHEVCGEKYTIDIGAAFLIKKYRDFPEAEGVIERATEKDMLGIAQLVVQDEDVGYYYHVNDLAEQLTERLQSGFGRNYIIRSPEGRIIAHIGTHAEYDGFAALGLLVVDKHYRKNLYGAVLEGYICRTMLEEGWNVYSFVYKRLRRKLLANIGNELAGELGKLTLIS